MGIVGCACRNTKDKDKIRFLSCDVRIDEHILYVIFTEYEEENANYMIINDLSEVNMMVYQASTDINNGILV